MYVCRRGEGGVDLPVTVKKFLQKHQSVTPSCRIGFHGGSNKMTETIVLMKVTNLAISGAIC